jgi:hypothetical protein|tara:strand:- start:221 stop:475 length:255 start_codon:yes stop_codon:yes gene_type:complete
MGETEDLMPLVVEALEYYDGSATLLEVSKYLWKNYENELREKGDIFYRWQYVLRWAGMKLRKQGKIIPSKDSPRGVWLLTNWDS